LIFGLFDGSYFDGGKGSTAKIGRS
jgi:hypothetical protein